ncbi:type I glyceraldehyde-3-phosphate dehydrogenase [Candidatus Similichlamydia laticola]|uniref:NAD-dependent glyceraldehyde-3-phosphate dehydrogenase n=1 Tax=Candidatus Similichlamydia laticola TaxID=2170265 RepID=A0A369K9Y3_9BACT|nr:glyceraldehyde 3-phosphate dehydrogenase NAD-binding domain-containing protein [Candidatus Similichlamydia laticola]RDB31401.1 NAD-dependent glyceraldehyde-3-phosphate dehydrogenase [Candidatus Similichlamydia laticola]
MFLWHGDEVLLEKMTCKVAINGFGRIGRAVFRRFVELGRLTDIVALNDLASSDQLAYLLSRDSTHGSAPFVVSSKSGYLVVDGHHIAVLQESDPSRIDWCRYDVRLVIESSGRFRSLEQAGSHLSGGVGVVLVSSPAKGVPSFVWGVNHEGLVSSSSRVFSAASCTTNCATPLLAVLDRAFGIEACSLSTIHAVTVSQSLLDGPSAKNFRLGRGALQNIIPTSTGASKAVEEILPQLKGRLTGSAFRVPLPDISLLDLVLSFRHSVSLEEVFQALREASTREYEGILTLSTEDLVSTDILGNTHSSVVDCKASSSVEGSLIKLVAWYDNERGYSARVVDLAQFICDRCLM